MQPSGGHYLQLGMWPALHGGQVSIRGASSTATDAIVKEFFLLMASPAMVLKFLLRVNRKCNAG